MIANTIEEVIQHLDAIIEESKTKESPLGYFAALYRTVTISVKNKLGQDYFEDDVRMERLDVIFANRYLSAYENYKTGQPITSAWKGTFDLSTNDKLIVLQHLLLGMNVHINLDLGIAAAEVSDGGDFESLKTDFNKINDILFELVKNVERDLAEIWPFLLWILKKTRKADDFIIRFSMQLARDGAWRFARHLSTQNTIERASYIHRRDEGVAKLAHIITPMGMIEQFVFWIIRIGEKGTVTSRIQALTQ